MKSSFLKRDKRHFQKIRFKCQSQVVVIDCVLEKRSSYMYTYIYIYISLSEEFFPKHDGLT